jgi:hypothetical protein
MWVFLIQLAVTAILLVALKPKAEEPKPQSMTDINVPKASPDAHIPVVFGTVWLNSPNTAWYGDLSSRAVKKKGGKK